MRRNKAELTLQSFGAGEGRVGKGQETGRGRVEYCVCLASGRSDGEVVDHFGE